MLGFPLKDVLQRLVGLRFDQENFLSEGICGHTVTLSTGAEVIPQTSFHSTVCVSPLLALCHNTGEKYAGFVSPRILPKAQDTCCDCLHHQQTDE